MKLYNTASHTREEFRPLDPSRVTVYLCGPTVYGYAHIGNYRPPIIMDVLVRLLRRQYPNVVYARNITDIEDKINKVAAEEGVPIEVITQRFTKIYHDELKVLCIEPPDIEPKVTDNVPQILAFIRKLLDTGHAYVADQHVLFDISTYDSYGDLGRRNLHEMREGARVEVATYKRNAGDFVLWKPSNSEQPGWQSPWGRGRPGWHIECSAMSAAHLGETIDIHAGGQDLIFPHHENEQAQSVCAHGGKPFVRYWLHNGLVNIDKEKMSKSLGNTLLMRDLLEQFPGEVIRMVLLSTHYRSPLEWNEAVVENARNNLDRLYGALRYLSTLDVEEIVDAGMPDDFLQALSNDLNTPRALTMLAERVRRAYLCRSQKQATELFNEIRQCGQFLGLLHMSHEDWFSGGETEDREKIEQLVAARESARAEKNWQRADALRAELTQMGVAVEDSSKGVRWRRLN